MYDTFVVSVCRTSDFKEREPTEGESPREGVTTVNG